MPRRPLSTLALCLLVALAGTLAFGGASASAAVEGFRNSSAINLPGNGNASPYPSTINVPAMEGRITSVTVTFHGFSHGSAQSVNALLVAPDGKTSHVMNGACATNVSLSTFVFSDSGPTTMPPWGPCDKAVYRPTENFPDGHVNFGSGVPPGPYSANFNNFLGSTTQGAWKLYIKGYGGASSGKIAGGWSLTLETRSPDLLVPGPGAASGMASPYPLSRTVSGVDGVITDVNVLVPGIYHQNAADLGMMLVGPGGSRGAVLMADSCPGDMRYGYWLFDDEASKFPTIEQPCDPGTYKPVGRSDNTFPLAPYFGAQTALSNFDLADPNGDWRLYVYDDHPGNGNSGLFLSRFELQFQTRPKAALGFTASAIELAEGQSGELTLSRSAGAAQMGFGSVVLTTTAGSAGAGDFKQETQRVFFAAGETEEKVKVEALADSEREPGETFEVKLGEVSGDASPAGTTAATVTIRDASPVAGPGPAGDVQAPASDRSAPRISGVSLAPKRFGVSRRRTATVARVRRGTRIGYSLSEAAAVRLRFERAVTGRRSAGRCLPKARVRRGRPCRRWVAAGTLRRASKAGANRVAFSGRIGRRALRPGAYRLILSATDAAGNGASARPRALRVVR